MDDQLEQALSTVDSTPLELDDLYDVKKALIPVMARWRAVGEGLRLQVGILDRIENDNPNNSDSCMGEVASEWLKKNYNLDKFGEPSWKWLVEVVGSPVGGNNLSHAMAIIEAHTDKTVEPIDIQPGNAADNKTGQNQKIETAGPTTPTLKSSPGATLSPTEKRTNAEELAMTPGAIGAEVVEACIEKVQRIIPDDNQFMRRLAYVMSRDGKNMKKGGGIWQVSQYALQDTKNVKVHKALPNKHYTIREAFDIDWLSVKFSDLDIPLYSALAARLFLSNFEKEIPTPTRVDKQAMYWHYYYMSMVSSGSVDEDDFTSAVHELEDS